MSKQEPRTELEKMVADVAGLYQIMKDLDEPERREIRGIAYGMLMMKKLSAETRTA